MDEVCKQRDAQGAVVNESLSEHRECENHELTGYCRLFAFDGDVAEEKIDADVVHALERAGDHKRGSEGTAQGGACEERRQRPRHVAGGVGVGSGRRSLGSTTATT